MPQQMWMGTPLTEKMRKSERVMRAIVWHVGDIAVASWFVFIPVWFIVAVLTCKSLYCPGYSVYRECSRELALLGDQLRRGKGPAAK